MSKMARDKKVQFLASIVSTARLSLPLLWEVFTDSLKQPPAIVSHPSWTSKFPEMY